MDRQPIRQAREMMASRRESDIDEQAFGWVDLLDQGPLSPERQREFDAWINSSPRHHGAFVRASAASVRFERLGAFAGGRPVYTKPAQFDQGRRRMLRAVALSATGMMAGGVWLSRDWIADAWRGVRYTTAVGQVWQGHLPDGSQMLLNTATEVLVKYSFGHREIRLRHGEAMFAVTGHAAKPFMVRVGEWVVHAVRAGFAVRHDVDTFVTVTEGSIDILHEKLRTIRERLTAGQEAVIDVDGLEHLRQISEEEAKRRFAWRAGSVVFDGQPLRAAIAEMNRYSTRKIRCEDPTLCARLVAGVYPVNDIEVFLTSIQATFNADVVSKGNLVLLTPRDNLH